MRGSKVSVVTGGAMGIGASVVRLLASEGHRVVFGDVAHDEGQALAARLIRGGAKVLFVPTDITHTAEVVNLMSTTVSHFGVLDWLVNNAGIALAKAVHETSEEEWNRVLSTNLTGAWLCTKFAIPHLKGRDGAAIVNVASNAGLVGFANLAAYCASKGGMIQLTKATALDCAPLGIRVNAVAPGHTRTPMGEGFIAAQRDPAAFEEEFINQKHPLGRMAEPDEVARAILFLLQDASFSTGAVLSVDGGYVAT